MHRVADARSSNDSQVDIVHMLVAKGCDVLHERGDGRTPVEVANDTLMSP